VPGLHSISIDPEHALAEYLRDQLPMRAVAEMLGSSRMFQYFAAATPGLRELLTVGKIWDLVQPRRRTGHGGGYDVAIVDAPATGHALGFLRAPRTFAEIARVGPIARQAGIIDGLLRDGAQTGVVAVAVPAEMPVNEAVLLREELERDGPPLNRVIANGVYPRRFGPRDARKLEQALADAPSPRARTALRAALSAATRIRVQEAQLARLAEETETRPVELPFLFEPHWTPAAVGRLSEILEREL
jgi:anion-transporting  ArsA/GET3 family ATPase